MRTRSLRPLAAAPLALLIAAGCEAPEPTPPASPPEPSTPAPGATAIASTRRPLVPGPGIPSNDRPAGDVGRRISPIMGRRPLNQPAAVNGALFLAGNAVHEIWSVATPEAPVRLSELISPHSSGEAESHQLSFARFEDGSLHAATISGRGVDLWDISDPAAPVREASIELPGINYGDFTAAVWGVSWQGHHLFVGGTNTGLHVIDTTDPRSPRVLRRVASSALGGVSAGPLFALGNLLVVTTPKENGGIATVDIGAPEEPVLLDAHLDPADSYIGAFFGTHAHLLSPFRTFDVLSDPTDIRLVSTTNTPPTEYVSFADDRAFVGSLRRTARGVTGVLEYTIDAAGGLTEVRHFAGRDLLSDDQFSVALGNLLVVADDERGYGAYLTVRQAARDTTGPRVIAVHPPAGARDQPLSTRVGLSLSDQVELTSATLAAVELRAPGGMPVPGRFGVTGTTLVFSPSAPLLPETTYTVRVPAGGLRDPVGNAVDAPWESTFTTGRPGAAGVPCAIAPPAPVTVGSPAALSAAGATEATHSYGWSYGDATTGSGASTTHAYAEPGRYAVALTVVERPVAATRFDRYEAEEAALSGGVRTQTDNAGFSGPGYADFPALGSAPTLTFADLRAARPAVHELVIRYANGDRLARRLDLRVNGTSVGLLEFVGQGAWTTWAELRVPVALTGGLNTVELRGVGGAGPNVDRVELSVLRASTCAATQIVHRAIPGGAAPVHSTPLVVQAGRAWVTNPDHGSVSLVDAATHARLAEIELGEGARPRTLAAAPDGSVWVTTRDGITILDGADGHVLEAVALGRGAEPYGLLFAPDGRRAYAALEARGEVVALDPATRAVVGTVVLGRGTPVRGLAITGDGRRLLVTRFISAPRHGEVFEVDTTTLQKARTWSLAESIRPDTPDEGRGVPNYLSAIVLNPDGSEAWIPSKQDNVARGMSRDGEALTHDATVRPILTRLDLGRGVETPERRIDLNDASMPVAAVISPLGDLVFAAVQGSNKIEVRETYGGRIAGSISVGRAPEGLALVGDRLYVQDVLDRTLTVVDVRAFLAGTDSVAPALATVPLVEAEVLAPAVLRGKRLFYDASDPRLAQEGYISCAACHLDGREDGRVWDFTDRGEGLRNTITLEGRAGMAHGALHWSANFDEVQDFENDIRNAFGGTGLLRDEDWATHQDPLGEPKAGLSEDLDALAAYVTSLATVPTSPWRAADGALTADGRAGREVFFQVGCAECHAPPLFTDRMTHDVGTLKRSSGGRRGEALTGIDTPTLLGVFQTPPYLHDGSAATLADTVARAAHGGGEALSAEQQRLLVAYLEQLDGSEVGAMPGPSPGPDAGVSVGVDGGVSADGGAAIGPAPLPDEGGCGCRTQGGFDGGVLLLGLALIAGGCLRGRLRG